MKMAIMMPPLMLRPARVLFASIATVAVAAVIAGCGTQKISVSSPDPNIQRGAVLFNQRCSGCHTLSYAATHGSAHNVRSAQFNNGPDFDVRCERPAIRVLYAIENGGFAGAIMPQNVVVGQNAIDVAEFVSTYAGRQSPKVPGVVPCDNQSLGPSLITAAQSIASSSTASATAASTASAAKKSAAHAAKSAAATKKTK
jgi:mono/diheme cytochrome c family protein